MFYFLFPSSYYFNRGKTCLRMHQTLKYQSYTTYLDISVKLDWVQAQVPISSASVPCQPLEVLRPFNLGLLWNWIGSMGTGIGTRAWLLTILLYWHLAKCCNSLYNLFHSVMAKNVFPWYARFLLTIKHTERRPKRMRIRLIISRFLSTIFWFILSSLTPAVMRGSLLPSYSVSSSSLKWNLWSLFNNRLNLKEFIFYRDSALARMEWLWSPSLGSNNGSMIVTFGRVSASSMIC